MEFEYDPAKSRSNKEKHGIDFEEGQALWDDPNAVRVGLHYEDEPRYLVVGLLKGKHWSAICTDRGGRTRIISMRRARKNEEQIYEDCKG